MLQKGEMNQLRTKSEPKVNQTLNASILKISLIDSESEPKVNQERTKGEPKQEKEREKEEFPPTPPIEEKEKEKENTETIKECKSENNKKIVTFNSTFNSSVDVLKMIEFKNDLNYNYNCFEKGKEEESEECTENNCVICSIF